MPKQYWTEEQDGLLMALVEQGATFEEIGDRLNKTSAACRGRTNRLRAKGISIGNEPKVYTAPELPPVKTTALDAWQMQVEKPTWREIVDHAKAGAELHNRLRPITTKETRKIKTDHDGIFLVHMADFHLGSPATDHQMFVETADLLLSDPRFFLLIAGPDQETAFAWFYSAEVILEQVISPALQLEAYRQWLDEMFSRTLAVCGDNHTDERLERMLGDIGLVWRTDVPYFRTYGILELWVNDIQYEEVVTHKYKGHSMYHAFQPALRMMRDINPLADIYCTAHTHAPGYMNASFFPEIRKEKQHFLVTGTFKTGEDVYGLRNFGKRGVLGLPTLYLSGKSRQIIYFESPEMALQTVG